MMPYKKNMMAMENLKMEIKLNINIVKSLNYKFYFLKYNTYFKTLK